jgi:uncharacterized protein DUF6582
MYVTWKPPHMAPGTPRRDWPANVFAFPKQRKEPLIDASHVRSAIARFNQVDGVSQRDREIASNNIRAASDYFGLA